MKKRLTILRDTLQRQDPKPPASQKKGKPQTVLIQEAETPTMVKAGSMCLLAAAGQLLLHTNLQLQNRLRYLGVTRKIKLFLAMHCSEQA